MKFTDYKNFFENVAKEYIPISHSPETRRFAVLDIDDIHNLKKAKINFNNLVMILENPEGQYSYEKDKGKDNAKAAFLLVRNVKVGDEEDKQSTLDFCKAAGEDIMAMFLHRKNLYAEGQSEYSPYKFMDLDTTHYMKVGPLFENCHGFRFEIDLNEEFLITVDLTKWQSL